MANLTFLPIRDYCQKLWLSFKSSGLFVIVWGWRFHQLHCPTQVISVAGVCAFLFFFLSELPHLLIKYSVIAYITIAAFCCLQLT